MKLQPKHPGKAAVMLAFVCFVGFCVVAVDAAQVDDAREGAAESSGLSLARARLLASVVKGPSARDQYSAYLFQLFPSANQGKAALTEWCRVMAVHANQSGGVFRFDPPPLRAQSPFQHLVPPQPACGITYGPDSIKGTAILGRDGRLFVERIPW